MYKKEAVKGYEEYSVDTNGVVYSKRNKPLKYSVNHSGYQIINFYINHQRKGFGIHTLVAKQFIPNSDINKTQVNHKDGNKQNNNVDNLEWTTPIENVQHSIQILGKNNCEGNNPNAKPIQGVNKNGDIIKFDSVIQGARYFNKDTQRKEKYTQNSLWRALNGFRKTYKGYTWEYVN